MVLDRDEVGLERAYFDNECPHFFAVDWREDDADIVACCAEAPVPLRLACAGQRSVG
jgi:hypothetical protein